jgi:hypothetical protein
MLETKLFNRAIEAGKWKIGIEGSKIGKGWVPERVCLVGLRQRDFPLLLIDNKEFGERISRDGQGFYVETPYITRGVPVVWTYQGLLICLWPIPVHAWRIKIHLYREKEENDPLRRWHHALRGGEADSGDPRGGDRVATATGPATITLQRDEYRGDS